MAGSRTVLITGCSEGGLGDALAQAFHAKGLRVIATARNPTKIAHFAKLGIETLLLDVLSKDSITRCVQEVSKLTGGSLDILLNNSGTGYRMPISDMDIEKGRTLFDLNVWAPVQVIQAFLPLLRRSENPMIVNHTSSACLVPLPLGGAYNASKAAIASMTDTLRLEMKPFGIKVVDLRTGVVKSNIFENSYPGHLPENSMYSVARKEMDQAISMTGDTELSERMVPADVWARQVVSDLLVKNPSIHIYRGGSAFLVWFGRTFLWHTFFDNLLMSVSKMDVVAKKLKDANKEQ